MYPVIESIFKCLYILSIIDVSQNLAKTAMSQAKGGST